MRSSIEMHGVHDVREALQRTLGNQMDILIPVGATHEYDIVLIVFADFANDLLGVFLQVYPFVLDGLVVDFVDNVRILAVFAGHLAKKLLGLFRHQLVRMPVDDDVDVLLDGGFDDGRQTLHGELGVLLEIILDMLSDSRTDDTTVPVVLQRLHGPLVIEARPQVVPAQTDTTQNDGIALFVAELGTFYLQFSVLLDGVDGMYVTCQQTQHNGGQ